MRVWLAEKSSFGKDLAEVLGNPKQVAGIMNCWDTDKGRVVCASGHLVQLAEPEDYDEKYENWNVADLPIIPDRWKTKEIEGKERWLESIRKGMAGATEIIVATDAGREGEYIAYLILHYLGLWRVPKKRLWTSGANHASIAKAVASLKPYEEKFLLAEAAQVRAESDWIEGMNLTRLFTTRFAPDGHREPLSIGRVQTAVLALIVRRSREIQEFKPRNYHEVSVKVEAGPHSVTLYHRPSKEKRIWDAPAALDIAKRVNMHSAPVIVEAHDRAERPPSLFESSSLQIRAYNLWGWAAEHTETIAQSLYDTHKLISYPRTDGTLLLGEQWQEAAPTLDNISDTTGFEKIALKDGEFFPALNKAIPDLRVKRSEVFNTEKFNKSGADHHGIIPTVEKADLSKLNADEQKLYALIVRQYLAQFYPDCLYRQTKMTWKAEGVEFVANGRTIVSPGWRSLFGKIDQVADKAEKNDEEENEENVILPHIPTGTMGTGKHPRVITKTTKSPKQFTEGSIISAMRDLSSIATDDATRELLKKAPTIGTKSTWGDTIKKLRDRYYIISSKGKLAPTALGDDLIGFCDKNVPKLVSVETTAVLEKLLCDVEAGQVTPDKARAYLQKRNIDAIRLCLAAEDTKLRAPEGSANKRRSAPPAGKAFADFPEGSIIVEIPYDAADQREAAKALGGRFNGDTKKWHLPKNGDNAAEARRRGWTE